MSVCRNLWCIACLLSVAAGASDAAAQEMEEARRLFEQAREAVTRGDFGTARQMLERSLELAPRPPTAVNLARVHERTAAPLAAARIYDQLLAGEYGELDPGARKDVRDALEDLQPQLATLRARVSGADDVEMRVDGVRVPGVWDDGALVIRLPAGQSTVTVVAANGRTVRRSVTVEAGERAQATFELPELAPLAGAAGEPGPVEPVKRDDEATGGVWRSPWLWLGVVAVVAAGVTTGLVLGLGGSGQTLEDPVWGSASVPAGSD